MLREISIHAYIFIWEIVSMDSIAYFHTQLRDKLFDQSQAKTYAVNFTPKITVPQETNANFHIIFEENLASITQSVNVNLVLKVAVILMILRWMLVFHVSLTLCQDVRISLAKTNTIMRIYSSIFHMKDPFDSYRIIII